MQIRILAGCKRLMMALAIASLIFTPAGAATPLTKGTPASGTPASSGGVGQPFDDSSKPVEPILYSRSTYVWPFSSGPVYGTVEASRMRDAGVLHTQVGSFDLTRGMPNLPSALRSTNRLATLGSQYFLLQVHLDAFTNGAFDEMKNTIVAQGGAVLAEFPVAAFVVRMTPGAYSAIRASDAIISLEPYQPAFKLSPEIGRAPLLDPVKAGSDVYSLALRLFPGENSEAVASALVALGVQVTNRYVDMVFVDADRSKLAAIASLEPVFMITEVLPKFQMSEETTTTIQTGKWNNGSTPYNTAGVDGGGLDKVGFSDDQLLMVLDTGIQLDAADLSNSRTDAGVASATHRKVAFYGTTQAFGGVGDLLGCDGSTTSGVTHGHTVAVIALGNATKVAGTYGAGFTGVDRGGNAWALDGVAPRARMIAYDAQITPATGRCDDPSQGNLLPGDLYNLGLSSTSALADGYAKGARISNLSWGSVAPNTYDADAQDIDDFLYDKSDAMVFIAAGNSGRDKNGDRIPDPNTIGSPANAKNAIVIGSSRNADDLGDPDLPNSRHATSGNGPATAFSLRIAPLLMAPGTDAGALGLGSEFHCRSNDNDQSTPVECDVIAGQISTSYATAAAAGAGLLIRDYFAQGFYPDGTNTNPANASDKVATISGSLLKAILVTSADWMNQPGTQASQTPTNEPWGTTPDFFGFQGNLTMRSRGNYQQGFGRIQLTNSLPLQSYPGAVSGLIVDDGGGLPAGLVHSTTLNMKIDAGGDSRTCSNDKSLTCTNDTPCLSGGGTCVPYSVNVCDTTQPLTIAIAWLDPSPNLLDTNQRDLNLEVTSPSGRVYLGNFFSDDRDNDLVITGTEDCTYSGLPWPPNSAANVVDAGPWSLPSSGTGVTCTASTTRIDIVNNVEAIFLSPDSRLNGIANDPATTTLDESTDNQIEQGAWKVLVKAPSSNGVAQNYSIAITGGVCLGSAARIQKVLPLNQLAGGGLTCNDSAVVTIDEIGTTTDPVGGLTAAEIATRTRIDVIDTNGIIVDTECGTGNTSTGCGTIPQKLLDTDFSIVSVNGDNIRFELKKILLTEGTAADKGNGALDVRDGYTIQVTYQDEVSGVPDTNARRTGSAPVGCKPVISSGGVVFGQFGKDAFTLVNGGCEKDARGFFTFGFPDRYMDAGELVSYTVAFQSAEQGTQLVNVAISLKAVTADANSPANCKPGTAPTAACPDPNRLDNPTSPFLTVLDSPKIYGALPAAKTITPVFTIKMQDTITGTQKVDMIIGVTSKTAGKSSESLIAKREVLNADENSVYFSTDYPTGGTGAILNYDINNNEILEAATTDPHSFGKDYIFEMQTYSDMTNSGTNLNTGIQAPWNFDTNNGGFVGGLQNTSRPSADTIAQWGEDKNYNGLLDGFCSTAANLACTQDGGASEGCKRCVGNPGRACLNDTICAANGEGTCDTGHGTCNFALGEDRDPADTFLNTGWSTAGGCGWQTKATPSSLTGGVWHTGLISDTSTSVCLAATGGRCQNYETLLNGDLVGDNNWWELLLTPILNKVNQGLDSFGDPLYQVAITDWAFNMLYDIPDENTAVRLEFDTDTDKSSGAELFNDAAFTVGFGGKAGAVVGGNGPITSGFSMFARVSHCVDTDGNGSPDHCGTALGAACGTIPADLDNQCTGNDLSPTRIGGGNNRQGKNSCFFEGKSGAANQAVALEPYGLATPDDDDVANGYCHRSDSLNAPGGGPYLGLDTSVSCISNTECTNAGAPYTTCELGHHPATAIDAFVTPNGPGRNYSVSTSNGPDMRFTTLEDFYGDTGNHFRAALGFNTREPDANTLGGTIGYGVAVDDMVISWKETSLVGDTHDCTTTDLAQCADVETSAGVSFEGNSVLNLTVTDRSPYGSATPVNDCNNDGDFVDAGIDDNDCNNNGITDVTLKLTSTAEQAGEIVTLDQTKTCTLSPSKACLTNADCDLATEGTCNASTGVYKAAFPYSTFYNSPGSLFVVQSGTALPVITARYDDRWDGGASGSRCKNFLDPTQQGFVVATTSVNVTTGRIGVQSYTLSNVSLCSLTVGGTNKPCTANTQCATAFCTLAPTKVCSTNADCSLATQGVCGPTSEGLCNSCSLLPGKGCTSNSNCTSGQGVCTSTANRGDPDGFADTDETINLAVQFANKAGVDVDDLTATLGTTSPNIECITKASIPVGALANGALSNTANYPPFQFKVSPTVNRTSPTQVIQATFTLTMRSNKFDALSRAVDITLDLDLNAAGAASPLAFFESFETGLGFFTLDTIDANKRSVTLSNGYRCQYNDPFGLNSNSTGNDDCFLGFAADSTAGVNDWHVHTSTHGGMGRAFVGKQSLHSGVHLSTTSPDLDTTRLKQLDAIKTVNAIFMPLSGANPELNFAQQVSFVDSTSGVNVTPGEAADRGVVEVQLSNTGVPSGSWIKIYPFVNLYDQQGTDDFLNCVFDPIDDGNDEDSWGPPGDAADDPLRRLGPSSTCFPEFTFVRQGQTDYRKLFNVNDIGAATDGPGLQGCAAPSPNCLPANIPGDPPTIFNPGTWVRPRFSLVPFAGRAIRLRFVYTAIEIGVTQTMNLFFGRPNVNGDDGWYIDDINIPQALGGALTLSADQASPPIVPIACGTCAVATAAIVATPASLSGPGQIVTLEAKTSSVDKCVNGIVQYKFWNNLNGNGTLGDAGDILLRDWTDNSTFVDAPQVTSNYGVQVRCSSTPACTGAVASPDVSQLQVVVDCPKTLTLRGSFNQNIKVNKVPTNATITWPVSISVDVIKGDLSGNPVYGAAGVLKPTPPVASSTFTGTVIACLTHNSAPSTSVTDVAVPAAGDGFYYLVRAQVPFFCNEGTAGYTTHAPTEKVGRDTQIDADTVVINAPCD